MAATKTLTAAETKALREEIARLEATPRALVGTDQGTHGKPATHDVYETIAGERYAVRSFAGGNGTRITEAEARERTDGRVRHFAQATEDIRAARRRLESLRRQLRDAGA